MFTEVSCMGNSTFMFKKCKKPIKIIFKYEKDGKDQVLKIIFEITLHFPSSLS